MTAAFDAGDLYRSLRMYLETLRDHEEELNLLNVYPVPDSDTGTNMRVTMEAVMESARSTDSPERLLAAVERGALREARGNSGVILGQILIALARSLLDVEALNVKHLTDALQRASRAAYDSVGTPVEGTILTVARAASEGAARAASNNSSLSDVVETACDDAAAALRATPEQLPILKKAGVVDAAGKGLLLLLQCVRHALGGDAPDPPEKVEPTQTVRPEGPRYELVLILASEREGIEQLEDAWSGLGESIVVGGGDERWRCHVHTDDVEAAVEAAARVGEVGEVRTTDLYQETTPRGVSIVAVTEGRETTELFEGFGATCVLADGLHDDDLLTRISAALEGVSRPAILLANHPVAAQRADDIVTATPGDISVVGSHSVVQGLAALLAVDPDDPRLETMREVVEHVRYGEVRQEPDGYAAILGGESIGTARTPAEAVEMLVQRLIDDTAEVITVLTGRDVDEDQVARLEEKLRRNHPHVAVEIHRGGQRPLFVIGVE